MYSGKRDFIADKSRGCKSCRIKWGKKVKRRRIWVDEAGEVVRGQTLKDLGFGGFHSVSSMDLKDFKQRCKMIEFLF